LLCLSCLCAGYQTHSAGDGKWGLIDKAGKILFQTDFFLMDEFLGGLAQVYDGQDLPSAKIGYIDGTGKIIWRPSR